MRKEKIMKITIMKMQKGFILFITLIMLIVFAIVGMAMYEQTTMSTGMVQYVSFKQEAEDLSMEALNQIEEEVWARSNANIWAQCVKSDDAATGQVVDVMLCNPLPDAMVNQALYDLKEEKAPTAYTTSGQTYNWSKLLETGGFSNQGSVYYVVQNLGPDSEDIGYILYRITILAEVLGTVNVISAVTALPAADD